MKIRRKRRKCVLLLKENPSVNSTYVIPGDRDHDEGWTDWIDSSLCFFTSLHRSYSRVTFTVEPCNNQVSPARLLTAAVFHSWPDLLISVWRCCPLLSCLQNDSPSSIAAWPAFTYSFSMILNTFPPPPPPCSSPWSTSVRPLPRQAGWGQQRWLVTVQKDADLILFKRFINSFW